MTHAHKRMNPQHFGADLADIRIQINPEIQIRISDHIMALAEFEVSDSSCYYCYYYYIITEPSPGVY